LRLLDRILSKSVYLAVISLVVFAMAANFIIIAQSFFSPLQVVEGNSMSPAIRDDDAVFVTAADPASLYVGDIVLFNDPQAPGQVIMHRIISIEDESGEVSVVTKGDANQVSDPYLIPADTVNGKVSAVLPKAGLLLEYLKSPSGFILCVIIPFALLALYLIGRWYLEKNPSSAGFLNWNIIHLQ
jgi:signal peptidase I